MTRILTEAETIVAKALRKVRELFSDITRKDTQALRHSLAIKAKPTKFDFSDYVAKWLETLQNMLKEKNIGKGVVMLGCIKALEG